MMRAQRPRKPSREQRYARAHGYFWSPCPICGGLFGGHEAHGWLLRSPGRSSMTCPDCLGYWIGGGGRFVEVEPYIQPDGSVGIIQFSASSAWKHTRYTGKWRGMRVG